MSIEEHCGRGECQCTHRMCYKGWMQNNPVRAIPCVVCRQELYDTLSKMPPPGYRTVADLGKLQNRFKGAIT